MHGFPKEFCKQLKTSILINSQMLAKIQPDCLFSILSQAMKLMNLKILNSELFQECRNTNKCKKRKPHEALIIHSLSWNFLYSHKHNSISLRDFLPIHHFPEAFHIICSAVLLIKIISMFPDIANQKRGFVFSYRITCIRA